MFPDTKKIFSMVGARSRLFMTRFNCYAHFISPESQQGKIDELHNTLVALIEEVQQQENDTKKYFVESVAGYMLKLYPDGKVSWEKYCDALYQGLQSTRKKVYSEPANKQAETTFRLLDYHVEKLKRSCESLNPHVRKYMDALLTVNYVDFHRDISFFPVEDFNRQAIVISKVLQMQNQRSNSERDIQPV
jgi:hypothetical protein